MKKHKVFILFLLSITWANAQVAIGKSTISTVDGVEAPISLEFFEGTTTPAVPNVRGLILPWASTNVGNPDATYTGVTSPVDGTLLFDVSDEKIKYRKAGAWFDLTVKGKSENISGIANADLTADIAIQGSTLTDKAGAKAAIGANSETDTTDGVLVLTDTDKAMILPKVFDPQTTIQKPSAGMIVYDTNKKMLCVFNGTVWTFWKP